MSYWITGWSEGELPSSPSWRDTAVIPLFLVLGPVIAAALSLVMWYVLASFIWAAIRRPGEEAGRG